MSFVEQHIIQDVVEGTFLALSKLIPAKNKPPLEKYDLSLIRRKYRSIESILYLSFFVLTPALVYLLTLICTNLQRIYLNSKLENVEYIFFVSPWAFTIPLIFLSLIIFGALSDKVMHAIGLQIGHNEEEWQVFYYDMNQRQSYGREIDDRKMTKYFSWVTLIFTIPALILAFDNYSYITTKSIVTNSYFSFTEKSITFSDIQKILHITRFKNKVSKQIEKTSSHYSVIAKDNQIWDTLNLTINHTPQEEEVVNYISQKSKVPITSGVHNIDDLIDLR